MWVYLFVYCNIWKKYVNFGGIDKGFSVPIESNPTDRVRQTELDAAVLPMEGSLSKVYIEETDIFQ